LSFSYPSSALFFGFSLGRKPVRLSDERLREINTNVIQCHEGVFDMKKIGWIMTALFALFMLGASVGPKLLGAEVAVNALAELGWPSKYLLLIGGIELLGTVLFIIPRTAALGAVVMTGLIGGAIASHLRVGSPLFSHTLFGIYLALFMWLALWLRERGVRKLLPLGR
jgi:hypothetical protein